jgi:hypothetical protein
MEAREDIQSHLSDSESLSVRSRYSSQSILSRQRTDPVRIKPSTVKSKMKEAVFWTRVITDGSFASPVSKQKVKYNNTQRLHNSPYPDLTSMPHLQGSIIKLPKVDAHAYVAGELETGNLMSDQQMLEYLDGYLQRPSLAKFQQTRLREAELDARIANTLNSSELVQDALADGNQVFVEELRKSMRRQLTNDPDAEQPFNFLKYRRDAKHKAKMFKMAQMYFQDKMKPRHIASKLDFSNKFVREHVYLIRKKLKKLK